MMKIYNEHGEYGEAFNSYLHDILSPAMDAVAKNAIEWIDEHGASGIDYRVLEAVLCEEISLQCMSAWMLYIEKRDLHNLGDSE